MGKKRETGTSHLNFQVHNNSQKTQEYIEVFFIYFIEEKVKYNDL